MDVTSGVERWSAVRVSCGRTAGDALRAVPTTDGPTSVGGRSSERGNDLAMPVEYEIGSQDNGDVAVGAEEGSESAASEVPNPSPPMMVR
jgi:hypothetical protein